MNSRIDDRIFDRQSGLWYENQGDYYLPCLKTSDEAEQTKHIGIWGRRHTDYLKLNHKVIYYNYITRGKLNNYLADINDRAENMFSQIVSQLEKQECVDEVLKGENSMLWVKRMNNIQERAREVVNSKIIYI